MAENNKKWTIGSIIGLLILVIAVIRSCEGRNPTHSKQTQDDLSHPTIVVDGDLRIISIVWDSQGGAFDSPKTYRSSGTHFTDKEVFLSCEDMRQGNLRADGVLVLSKELETWHWSVGGFGQQVQGTQSFTITIPKNTIPQSLQQQCVPTKQLTTKLQTESLSSSMMGLRVFEDTEFSIGYPSSWEEIPSDIQTRFRDMLSEESTLRFAAWSRDTTLNIQVVQYSFLKEGMSLEDFYQQNATSKIRSDLQLTVDSTEKVTVSGLPAFKEMISYLTLDGLPARSAILYVVQGPDGWIVIMGGKPATFNQYRALIKKSLWSLTLKKR